MLDATKIHSVMSFEQRLGDSYDANNVFCFKHCIDLDEQELFPQEAYQLLDSWQFYDFYIPKQYGGKLTDYSEAMALIRALARRDLTVAIAHSKTYLGALPIWQSGSLEQRYRLAEIIKQKGVVSLGLTEKEHGGDLLANEVEALACDGGYRLSGEKWLINNATRCVSLIVFAKTKLHGGPRGFSLFFVEKDKLDPSSFIHLPKIKTLGIRGADINGIAFKDAFISHDTLVGSEGAGLEIILKSMQVSRMLVPAMSLGVADTALRITMSFALHRKLRGTTVFNIPYAQAQLVDAFLDLLICDCLMIAGARALHVLPSQMSLWSAIIKYFVPTTIDAMLDNLSSVLGARYYLRQEHASGIFQKILRDHRIISLFDGSTCINLNLIGQQLRHLSETRLTFSQNQTDARSEELSLLFSLRKPVPNFAAEKLMLSCKGQDVIMQSLHFMLSKLADHASNVPLAPHLIRALKTNLAEIDNHIAELISEDGSSWHQSADALAITKKYAALFTAIVCVQIWLHNKTELTPFFQKGNWLSACIVRLLSRIQPTSIISDCSHVAEIADELLALFNGNQLFSICPYELAKQKLI